MIGRKLEVGVTSFNYSAGQGLRRLDPFGKFSATFARESTKFSAVFARETTCLCPKGANPVLIEQTLFRREAKQF